MIHFSYLLPFVRGIHYDTLFVLMVLCQGNPPFTADSSHKGPVIQSLNVVADVRLNKRLNKQSFCRRFKMPWRQDGVSELPADGWKVFYDYLCSGAELPVRINMINALSYILNIKWFEPRITGRLGQCYGCWFPGSSRCQSINSDGINSTE